MRSHEIEFQQIVCMYPWTAQALTICELFQSTTPVLLYWQRFTVIAKICQNSLYSLSKILNIPRHCWDLISMFINFLHQPHRRWVFGQVTPTLETAWMFETDFARPRRKDGCGTKHFLRKKWKKLAFLPNAPSENSLPSYAKLLIASTLANRHGKESKLISKLIQDGKWKNWISANFYIRVMKLVCLQFRLKAMSSILCSNSAWSKNERRVEGKGHEARASPVPYLFPIKTMPNASCPIRWALLTASTILILASASRGLWKRHRHSSLEMPKMPRSPKFHIEATSSSVNIVPAIHPIPGLSVRAQCHVPRVQPTAQSSR